MRRPRRLAAAVVLALTLTVAGTMSACDSSDDSGATDSTGPTTDDQVSTPPTSDTASTEPSDSTEPTEDSMSSSPSPTTHDNSSVRRAKQSQVALADMPGFNSDWVWDKASGNAGPRPTSPGQSRCMQASLTAIGGVVEYSTAYTVAGDSEDEAVLTTAVFPDEHTAQMAESVLASWQQRCRVYLSRQPGVDQVAITDDRPTGTSIGPAHSRLVGFGPVQGDPESGYFNGEGYVRDGDVISYLVMHNVGQDYNYEEGREPVQLGLKAAADALERTR
jgi:hypothetical protein